MADQRFHYQLALQDFRRARRRASLEHLISILKGTSDELLSFEDVRTKLKMTGTRGGKLKEIPLDAIVGSVGRYKDFTRKFLPRRDSDEHRWATVQTVVESPQGVPPIQVYQIDEVYFVLDGNHRVSVARQLGVKIIEAYVIEVQTKIPISPDVQPDELAIKAEYAKFLSRTHLDEFRPEADLSMSMAGRYRVLEEQIDEHRYFMGGEQQREISYNEALINWYDTIYAPITQIIRQKDILKGFPNRTLTDIYLWISEYRAAIRRGDTSRIEEVFAEIQSKLPILPDVELDKLILDAEYVDFLERTRIDEVRPGADLRVTAPGKYRDIDKHIEVHRHFMGLEQQREIPYQEAVVQWYNTVYLPLAAFIRRRGMLRDFPNRTETDLYLWISERRAELEQRLGWKIRPESAAADLVNHFSSTPERILARIGEKVIDVLTPDELESGPAPGSWRREGVAARRNDRLFSNILIPLSGQESGWVALEQAIRIAEYEDGHLYGLHVSSPENEEQSKTVFAVRAEFARRCQEAGIPGELAVEKGETARKICERARLMDLVVLNLTHPPETKPIAKLQSRFRTIIRRCSRPVLAVPKVSATIRRALLAYDGSAKADEALFVGAYIGGYLEIPLVVVTVEEIDRTSTKVLSLARDYLHKRNVEARFVEELGIVDESILYTARAYKCDLIIMGGYGRSPLLEVMLGSTVDQVLRKSQIPVLICR